MKINVVLTIFISPTLLILLIRIITLKEISKLNNTIILYIYIYLVSVFSILYLYLMYLILSI